ncbi:MAG: YbjN domain-containing protein [Candidatus Bathyarchaeota archaeon]|nr:YbjN domain-containing protein [Candidatus Bathyarchaeota archaeon]
MTFAPPRDFKKAVDKINEYLHKFTGNKNPLTDSSSGGSFLADTLITYSSITTEVGVMQLQNQAKPDVVFSSPVVKVPKENPVVFFRQLLAWNYLSTDVAHFALSEKHDTIYLVLRRPVENLDYDEFRDMLQKVSNTTMNSLLLIRKQFAV